MIVIFTNFFFKEKKCFLEWTLGLKPITIKRMIEYLNFVKK
jgi:hypothetical protein